MNGTQIESIKGTYKEGKKYNRKANYRYRNKEIVKEATRVVCLH